MDTRAYATGVTWDIDKLFSALTDGTREKQIYAAEEEAASLIKDWRAKIKDQNIEPASLLGCIRKYELINEMCEDPYFEAYLYRAFNVLDQKRNELFRKIEAKVNQVHIVLMPIMMELRRRPVEEIQKIAESKKLIGYRYFIFKQIKTRDYSLSEMDEINIYRKNTLYRRALVDLYDENIGAISFTCKIHDEILKLSCNKASALFYSHKRSVRTKVYRGLLDQLSRRGMTFSSILNSLLLKNIEEDTLRGYTHALHRFNVQNDIGNKITMDMIRHVEAENPLVHRYYRIKSRLMELEDFNVFDILAPIYDEYDRFQFEEAKHIILSALGDFHKSFESAAGDFFENGLVDAEERAGKQNGAFCKCFAPKQKPHVSLVYTGTIRSLMELAHEIGHGIQYVLSSKKSYLNFMPVPAMAEMASTFIETIVAGYMARSSEFKHIKKHILAQVVENMITIVFRQNAITGFEDGIHEARTGHPLKEEDICRIWRETSKRLLGPSVKMDSFYDWGWAYIPHIFHRHFYCLSYVFGGLISIRLYQKYLEEDAFADKIVTLFGRGSEDSPVKLLEEMGLNISDKDIWAQCFQYLRALIDSFESDVT